MTREELVILKDLLAVANVSTENALGQHSNCDTEKCSFAAALQDRREVIRRAQEVIERLELAQ